MGLDARPVEDRVPIDDQERVAIFSQEMVKKWLKGREEYGPEMKLNPLTECMDECLDIANYALEQYFRIKLLKEKLDAHTDSSRE